jgi:hypothetical protein
MDHSLEDRGKFSKGLDLQLWGKVFPDVSGIGWHRPSSAAATESSSCKTAKVSFMGTLGWAGARLVAERGIRNGIRS